MGTNWPRGEKKSTSYLMCEENLLLDTEDGFGGVLFQDYQGGLCPNLMAEPQSHTALVRTVSSYNGLTPQVALHSLRVEPLLLIFSLN